MNSAALAEQVRESRFVRVQLGVIVALLLLIALFWVPKYQINQDLEQGRLQPEEIPQQVDQYRRTWVQIIGGAVVLAGLYFTYRRVLSTERNVEIAREGQITERFTRAIEQLGDEDRLAMRLGGIYALERIARDSERDHWTVMEVLTAFVRESEPVAVKLKGVEIQTRRIAPAAQAALTVIGRRNTYHDPEGRYLNLIRVSAPHATLIGADLRDATLVGADLRDAILFGVDLRGANLYRADLGGTSLTNADLRKADFTGASYELEKLAEAESVEGIKGLSDEELAELERLRQASDEDGEQPREEGDSQ